MTNMPRERVFVNVYNLSEINKYVFRFGIGVFHTGVQVYGKEYSYGGHIYEISGIFEMEPKSIESLGVGAFSFKETLKMGLTDFTAEDIKSIIDGMGNEFKGNKYHLLRKNCNHFTNAFVKVLCGKEIPEWINKLAQYCSKIPFLEQSLPKEILTPVALQENIKVIVDGEDGENNNDKPNDNKNHPSGGQ